MLIIRGTSGRTLLRAVLPYVLGLLAVVAVLAYYLHSTNQVADRAVLLTEAQSVQLSLDLTLLTQDSSASFMFSTFARDSMQFTKMRSKYTGLFGLTDYTLVEPHGDEFTVYPFGYDSLAVAALSSGTPEFRHGNDAGTEGLTVFYPSRRSQGEPMSLVRMDIAGSPNGGWRDDYRYSFFILAIAVIILIIAPALLLRLSDLRRQVEVQDFTGGGFGRLTPSSIDNEQHRSYPVALFQGPGAPAILRLDTLGRIVDLNDSAAHMLDISRDALSGALFYSLPMVYLKGADGPKRMIHPEELKPGHTTVVIESSSGELREIDLSLAEHIEGGLVLLAFPESPIVCKSSTESGRIEETRAGRLLSSEELEKVLKLAEILSDTASNLSDYRHHMKQIVTIVSGEASEAGPAPASDERGIQLSLELESISSALNDVLPKRASIQVETPGLLPSIDFSRQDLTQIIKNLVFYSLESVPGPVRIRLTAREVPSPPSDPVFSARCGTLHHRSVSLSFTDGSRMPVRLKEALLDPETDSSGIQRDFGSHISTAASVLSSLDCDPVLTEGAMGTTLHMIFGCSDADLFDESGDAGVEQTGRDMRVALCDASRTVRESVADALETYGMSVSRSSDVRSLLETVTDKYLNGIVLDSSVLEKPVSKTITAIRDCWPEAVIILTARASELSDLEQDEEFSEIPLVHKPYSPHEIMEVLGRRAASRG